MRQNKVNFTILTLEKDIKRFSNLCRKFCIVDQYDRMAVKERTKAEKNMFKIAIFKTLVETSF